jgi:hypothetical protein
MASYSSGGMVRVFTAPLRRASACLRIAAFAALAAGAVGCDIHGATEPGTLARIVVTPDPQLAPLTTQAMTALGFDAEGKPVAITPTWSVVAGGGTIDETGLFTAGTTVGSFEGTIVATVGGVSGSATATVVTGPIATITVTPSPVTVLPGAQQQLLATPRDVGGNPVGAPVEWAVVNGGGSISASGVFTAGSVAGTYVNTIRATSNGIATFVTAVVQAGSLATLTVSPNPASLGPGATQQFTVVARDAAGNALSVTPTWSVVAGGGTISSTGLFTAGPTPGTYTGTVRATSGSVSGSATVVVTTGTLAAITITPNPASLTPGAMQQFTATGRDVAGNPVSITPVWSIASSGSGGSISESGVYFAGGAPGVYANEVIATVGSVVGTASVVISGGIPTNSGFLGFAARFGILANTGVTCAGSGSVRGPAADVGTSPPSTVTGFPTPCTVSGAVVTDPATLSNANGDLATAMTNLQGTTGCSSLSGFDLSSWGPLNPLPPGCYTITGAATLNGDLALAGTSSSQWTFLVTGNLAIDPNSNVLLSGGAIPDNVRWVVSGPATVGDGSHVMGNLMATGDITLGGGITLQGRALSRSGAVSMTVGGVVIIKP